MKEINEGHLFIHYPSLPYFQEAEGSFKYNGSTINIILTKGKNLNEIRNIFLYP
ncbi:hypothetical protein K9L67_05930 [Candidatus Woesearchaeota archaeon]|nr:hypothetical protein [Candidatus Woesearchaeota archaeon]MCF7901733.1 hypothetical protein [Candidatus Woesearchaeota archaeon]MCF8013632.1 hypothetical protein [Candidatus Woesearchaeota archaeon]